VYSFNFPPENKIEVEVKENPRLEASLHLVMQTPVLLNLYL
jgi:hypothetical protein